MFLKSLGRTFLFNEFRTDPTEPINYCCKGWWFRFFHLKHRRIICETAVVSRPFWNLFRHLLWGLLESWALQEWHFKLLISPKDIWALVKWVSRKHGVVDNILSHIVGNFIVWCSTAKLLHNCLLTRRNPTRSWIQLARKRSLAVNHLQLSLTYFMYNLKQSKLVVVFQLSLYNPTFSVPATFVYHYLVWLNLLPFESFQD